MIYITSFILSSLMMEFGFRIKRKWISSVFIFLALGIPALIAGLRDSTIGVDRLVYGDDLFIDVLKSSSFLHMESRWEDWIEPGYIWFNYIIGSIFPSLEFFYFCLSFVMGLCVILAFKNLNITRFVGFAYATYLVWFFCPALNMMRQSLASAIGLYSISFLLKKNYLRYALLFLLAFSMHTSSVILLFYPFVLYILNLEFFKTHILKKQILLSFFVFLCFGCADSIMALFPFLFTDPSRYEQYFSGGSGEVYLYPLFFASFICCLVLLNRKIINKECYGKFLVFSAILYVFNSQLGLFGGEYIGRIAKFHQWVVLFAIPFLFRINKYKLAMMLALTLFLLFYWCYNFVLKGYDCVYPYSSKILGF